MKMQHQYRTAHQGIQSVAMMVGAVVVLVVTSLIVLISRPAPVLPPTNPIAIVAPAYIPARPITTNRFFQDEINAASALDLGDLQSPLATWPERISDRQTVTAPAAVAHVAQPRLVTSNRIFLDEIAGADVAGGSEVTVTPDEVTRPHAPLTRPG